MHIWDSNKTKDGNIYEDLGNIVKKSFEIKIDKEGKRLIGSPKTTISFKASRNW